MLFVGSRKKIITSLPDYIELYLKTLNTRNPEQLCEAQYTMMLFAKAAFNDSDTQLRDAFFAGFSSIIDKTYPLGELRSANRIGKIRLEPFLQDKKRSGSDSRRIFPFDIAKQIPFVRRFAPNIKYTEVSEQPLCQLQFSYLLSYTFRSWAFGISSSSKFDYNFANKLFDFLLRNIIIPYWTEVEAWHWLRPFPNMRELVNTRLDYHKFPEMQKPSYYKAFYDMDFFTLAIAADLLAAVENVRGDLYSVTATELAILRQIQTSALNMYQQRLESGAGFFSKSCLD